MFCFLILQRITLLERRNNELEAVLLRLSSAVERLLCLDEVEHVVNEDDIEVDDEEPSCEPVCSQSEEIEVATEAKEQSDTEAECEYDSETSENCENAQVPSTDSNSVLDAPADPLDQPKADEEENEETTEENNKPDEVEQNTVAEDEDDLKTQNDLEENVEEPGNINGSSARCVSKHICLELFIEFQKKLALFAAELKGVLNCSESAIRHGRVVQEWGKNVQLMFEQLLHERKKMMNYIEERETTLMQYREQFMAEKQIQARQLQNLVDEMKKYKELMETTEEACREKAIENSYRKSIADNIVEVLFERRLDEERAVILSLARQSKISEMKLFIMHQQNCIQDLQIQNKELRAVIEGLVGPDDIDVGSSFDEQTFDTDQSGTPASAGTPERRTLSETLTKIAEQPISLVSDVLNCDRGNYLPGLSTDGDIATVQAYDIGRGTETIEKDSNVVFDPLTVDYVREHCQQAEESDRRARAAQPKTEKTDDVEKTSTITNDTGDTVPEIAEDGRETPEEDRGVLVMQDGVQALNIEPYLRKKAEEERLLATLQEASGDGVDILNRKKTEEEVPDKVEMEQEVETDSTA